VICGTGLIYETSNPRLPSTTRIKVVIAPRINPVILNGNENVSCRQGSLNDANVRAGNFTLGKDTVGNFNFFNYQPLS